MCARRTTGTPSSALCNIDFAHRLSCASPISYIHPTQPARRVLTWFANSAQHQSRFYMNVYPKCTQDDEDAASLLSIWNSLLPRLYVESTRVCGRSSFFCACLSSVLLVQRNKDNRDAASYCDLLVATLMRADEPAH